MLKLLCYDDYLAIRYLPEDNGLVWLYAKIHKDERVRLRYTFSVSGSEYVGNFPEKEQLEEIYDQERNGEGRDYAEFQIGSLTTEGYYCLSNEVLEIEYDLFLATDIAWQIKDFVAVRNISIFRKLNKQGLTSLYIGGEHPEAMPESEFRRLLKRFPTSHEMNRYANARISSIINEFATNETNHETKLQNYLNNKLSAREKGAQLGVLEYEIDKYENLLQHLEGMLNDEINYSESQWQSEILNIIQLIYPKYIHVFEEVPVWDQLQKKTRKLDFLLLEADGNVDIIEIKKPFDKSIVTERSYRDNHVPLRELSGSIMQLEKYIFHLNRSGEKGEKLLNEKYNEKLPEGLEIKITNPSGFIITGRSKDLTASQKADFEIIKRKYNNVIDILTYDDLLNRLKVIINAIKKNNSE